MKADDLYAVHDFDIDLNIQLPIQIHIYINKVLVSYFVNIFK